MPYNARQEQNYTSDAAVSTDETAALTIAAFIRREAAKSNGVKIRENGGIARGAVHAIQDQLDVMRAYTGLGQRGEVILGTRSRRENQGLLEAGSLRIAKLLASENGLTEGALVEQVSLLLQDENFNGKTIIAGMRQRNDEITEASQRIGADLFRLFENKSNPADAATEMHRSIEDLRRAMEVNLEEARVTTGETFKFRQARAKGAIGVLKGAAAFAGGFAGGIGAIIGVSAAGGLNGMAYANNKNNFHREDYENQANSMDRYVNNLKTNYDSLYATLNPAGLSRITQPDQIGAAIISNPEGFFEFITVYKNMEQAIGNSLTLSPIQTTLLNKYTNLYNLINTTDVITNVDTRANNTVYSELITNNTNPDTNFILTERDTLLNGDRAGMTRVSAGQHFMTHGIQAGAIAGLGAIVKSTGMLDGIKHSAGNTIRSVGDGFNSILRPGLKSDNMTVPGMFGVNKGVSMDKWSVLSKKPAIIEFAKANNLDVIKNPVKVSNLMREAGLSNNSTDEQIASANLDAFTKNINSDAFKGGLIDNSGSLNYDNDTIVAIAKKAKIDTSDHAAVDKMLEEKKIVINADMTTADIEKLKAGSVDLKPGVDATPDAPKIIENGKVSLANPEEFQKSVTDKEFADLQKLAKAAKIEIADKPADVTQEQLTALAKANKGSINIEDLSKTKLEAPVATPDAPKIIEKTISVDKSSISTKLNLKPEVLDNILKKTGVVTSEGVNAEKLAEIGKLTPDNAESLRKLVATNQTSSARSFVDGLANVNKLGLEEKDIANYLKLCKNDFMATDKVNLFLKTKLGTLEDGKAIPSNLGKMIQDMSKLDSKQFEHIQQKIIEKNLDSGDLLPTSKVLSVENEIQSYLLKTIKKVPALAK
jgi:hypothetical protein